MIEPDLTAGDDGRDGSRRTACNPQRVLRWSSLYGGDPRRVLVVGCEPATFGPEDEGQMGLSEPVRRLLDEAITLVETLVRQI